MLCCPHCSRLSTILFNIVTPNCRLVQAQQQLSIVDNIEQCWQHNIVQCCFHQVRTGCSFLAVNIDSRFTFFRLLDSKEWKYLTNGSRTDKSESKSNRPYRLLHFYPFASFAFGYFPSAFCAKVVSMHGISIQIRPF